MSDPAVALFLDDGHPPAEVSIAAVLAAFLDGDWNLTAEDRERGELIAQRLDIKPGRDGEPAALAIARMFKDWRVMRSTMARAEGWPKEEEDGA